jgi:hypothetical protein
LPATPRSKNNWSVAEQRLRDYVKSSRGFLQTEELAHLPRALIAALWEVIDTVQATYHQTATKPEVS